jgi:3-oxoacyl-[acyl-carrier-protein] synthase-3
LSAAITGLGTAIPERIITNADLEAYLDTSDEWIVERTGIRERRQAGPNDTTASLAIAAGAAAIKDAGLVPDDIGLLIVATATPDQALPAVSAFVQDGLGLHCGAFDVSAACSGFAYGLVTASSLLAGGTIKSALVIGAETLTRFIDPNDRSTRVLFGDGAGAVVVQPAPDGMGLLGWDLGCDGSATHILQIPPGKKWVEMDGREVFRRAVRAVVDTSARTLERSGLTAADIDWFVPHQANQRIIDAACDRLHIPAERTIVNVDRFGNTSAASIPLALADTPVKDGDVVLLAGFGAGMTWASAAIRWQKEAQS